MGCLILGLVCCWSRDWLLVCADSWEWGICIIGVLVGGLCIVQSLLFELVSFILSIGSSTYDPIDVTAEIGLDFFIYGKKETYW